MIVETGFHVSIRRKQFLMFQKYGYCDVTVSATCGVVRHLYLLSATSNINYSKLRLRHRIIKLLKIMFDRSFGADKNIFIIVNNNNTFRRGWLRNMKN